MTEHLLSARHCATARGAMMDSDKSLWPSRGNNRWEQSGKEAMRLSQSRPVMIRTWTKERMWGWKEDNEFEEVDSTELDAGVKAETLGGSSAVIHTEGRRWLLSYKGLDSPGKGHNRKRSHLRTESWLRDGRIIMSTVYGFTWNMSVL